MQMLPLALPVGSISYESSTAFVSVQGAEKIIERWLSNSGIADVTSSNQLTKESSPSGKAMGDRCWKWNKRHKRVPPSHTHPTQGVGVWGLFVEPDECRTLDPCSEGYYKRIRGQRTIYMCVRWRWWGLFLDSKPDTQNFGSFENQP